MAKIGNEAKLILKLAAERSKQLKATRACQIATKEETSPQMMDAKIAEFGRGIDCYERELANIVLEMEEK